ncbi:MAG: glycosyltransferase family 4 protein, partial [Solirubrobacteraceae bacterium]
MRILLTSHYALPHLGGIEVAIDALARELTARGHDVCHVASAARRPDEPAGGADAPGYRVLRLPARNGLEGRLGVPWPVFSRPLAAALRREVALADVVHGHGALYMSSLWALLAARRRGRARVLTEHVGHVAYERRVLDLTQRAAFATMGRAAIRSAQAIVVLNEKVKAQMHEPAAGRPVVTIHNGVDGELFRPPVDGERAAPRAELGWDRRPRVLFVGRLVAKKGLDAALDAARHARGAFELCVVGPGRPPAAVSAHVELRGAEPRERVAQLYRAADAFLLPSRGEGFPVTAQEAMASGLPAVLAADPGDARYGVGAGAGVRQAPAEGAALARALAEL